MILVLLAQLLPVAYELVDGVIDLLEVTDQQFIHPLTATPDLKHRENELKYPSVNLCNMTGLNC